MFKAFVDLFAGMDWLTIVTFVATNVCFILWIFFRKLRFLPFIGIYGILATAMLRLKQGYANGNQPILFVLWTTAIVVGIYFIVNFAVKTIYKYKHRKSTSVGYMHKTEIKLNEKGTPDFNEMLGKSGICKTDLRPTGKVDFGDKVLDCIAKKGYIYAGNKVKVVNVQGYKIVVAKTK